jgi:hypothetical protein
MDGDVGHHPPRSARGSDYDHRDRGVEGALYRERPDDRRRRPALVRAFSAAKAFARQRDAQHLATAEPG